MPEIPEYFVDFDATDRDYYPTATPFGEWFGTLEQAQQRVRDLLAAYESDECEWRIIRGLTVEGGRSK